MLITEWDEDEAKEVYREEAREEGREEGLLRGREEILKFLEQGLSIEEIKEQLNLFNKFPYPRRTPRLAAKNAVGGGCRACSAVLYLFHSVRKL